MSSKEMESLENIIGSLDAFEKHIDAIIEEAQRQKVAIVEARAVLKLGLTKEITTKGIIGDAIALGMLTNYVLDKMIEQVDKATEKIEQKLEQQKKDMQDLEKRIPKKQ